MMLQRERGGRSLGLSLPAEPRVLIVGAGVIGLTTALCLKREGASVTVLADRFAPNLTSVVAGALWEWPPAVCGYHQNQDSLARSKHWCIESYQVFRQLSADPGTGVFLRPSVFYFDHPVDENARDREKMNELRDHVLGFHHDPALISEYAINPALGLIDAYCHLAPMVDTDRYLGWLRNRLDQSGCTFIRRRLEGDLRESEDDLKDEFGADAIVNCTGLGARELGDDSVYPLRGAL